MIKFDIHTNARQEKALNELFSQLENQFNNIDIKLLFSDAYSKNFLKIFIYILDQDLYNNLLEWLDKPCNNWHFDKKYKDYYYDSLSYKNGVWLNIQKVEKAVF